MKKWIAALFALPLSCLQAQTLINGFDNIRYWVGTGQNRAALVLQWNDGLNPVSMAWGYRWDGTATGLDMLRAIAGQTSIEDPAGDPVGSGAGADDRLALGLVQYSFGLSILSLEYSPSGDPVRTQSDWFNGYWQYLIRGGSFEYYDWETEGTALYNVAGSVSYDAAAWTSAPVGGGERPLINGAWDAYSFAPGFAVKSVQQPMAAPLPVPAATCAMDQGMPTVSAPTKLGFYYQLEYGESPAGPWRAMGDSEPGTGGQMVFQDDTADLPPHRFYRIAVRQTP
ncbi:MAG: hypothetical protein ACKOEG_05815 [Chthoniobacterales bacterium]